MAEPVDVRTRRLNQAKTALRKMRQYWKEYCDLVVAIGPHPDEKVMVFGEEMAFCGHLPGGLAQLRDCRGGQVTVCIEAIIPELKEI